MPANPLHEATDTLCAHVEAAQRQQLAQECMQHGRKHAITQLTFEMPLAVKLGPSIRLPEPHDLSDSGVVGGSDWLCHGMVGARNCILRTRNSSEARKC